MTSAEIVNGVVVRAIVGNPAWATNRLGGIWIATEHKVGKGWTYNPIDGFRPPQPYPSWVWVDDRWQAPTPRPVGNFEWDEATQTWLPTMEEHNDFPQ
jgi:hypothetical protein